MRGRTAVRPKIIYPSSPARGLRRVVSDCGLWPPACGPCRAVRGYSPTGSNRPARRLVTSGKVVYSMSSSGNL